MKLHHVAMLLLGLAACSGDSPSPEEARVGPAWFVDEARERGVDFMHRSGHEDRFLFPELMGGGVALFDKEGDGDLDLFLVQSGSLTRPETADHRLYENDGAGRFQDVTSASGVTPGGYGMGVAAADYDADGDVDLYITCVGSNRLLQNDGSGRFVDVTDAAGVGDGSWGTSAAFLDFDGDGHLDLFIANYVDWSLATEEDCFDPTGQSDYCSPLAYSAPSVDTLYRANGDGTFEDVTAAMGLGASPGNGLGVVTGDFDGDGLVDVFVANDQMPDCLWVHGEDGRLVNRAERLGCARDPHGNPRAGMGVDAADVEGDGDLDLLVVHMAREQDGFFRNRGGSFVEETRQSGIGMGTFRRTRFGVGFHDFNHDGWLDLYVANGRVNQMMPPISEDDIYAEPNSLLAGTPAGRWEPVSPAGGTSPVVELTSRGAAFGDLDGDGALDVVIGNREGRVQLLRNVVGQEGQWAALRLLDGGRDALGATASIEVDGKPQRRSVKPGYSYCSSSDPAVHFGLGAQTAPLEVEVRWADGELETFGPVPLGARSSLVRGLGR
ncbi:CRTAC1 family protein [bacterium]|nr:CRTAC1 family protein [bacterium]